MNDPRRPSPCDQTDPVLQLLREEFLAEQAEVEGSEGFADRLRKRIEVEGSAPVEVGRRPATRWELRSWSFAIAGIATAACLFVLVQFGDLGQADKSASEHKLVHRGDVGGELNPPDRVRLEEEDAVAALNLVNFGLGQSVRSVSEFRVSLASFLEPLRVDPSVDSTAVTESVAQPCRAIVLTDEELVAKITWQVLGLKP